LADTTGEVELRFSLRAAPRGCSAQGWLPANEDVNETSMEGREELQMMIEMKRRDMGHKDERWKLELREKAVLIDPAGKAVAAFEPLEALSRFRMPSLGGGMGDLRVQTGNGFLTFGVRESDLRQIEHFLNRTLTATRGKKSPVSAIQVALIVLAGLGAFAVWRWMGSGAPPAPALGQHEQALNFPPYAQGQSPHTPVTPEEQAPASRPPVKSHRQVEPPQPTGIAPALLLREEAMAIEGLRACALCTGQYPESLATIDGHLTDVIRQLRQNPMPKVQSTGLDPGPARSRDEKIVSICRLMSFSTFLRGSNRDSAYYGHVVKPAEAHRVLLRWRLTSNEYRVIYGDLRVEGVTPDRLARLEAMLPR
jgi:hypothetical protein